MSRATRKKRTFCFANEEELGDNHDESPCEKQRVNRLSRSSIIGDEVEVQEDGKTQQRQTSTHRKRKDQHSRYTFCYFWLLEAQFFFSLSVKQ